MHRHILPQALQGLYERGLSRFGAHVSGAGVQIEGTDGVAYDLALIAEWFVILAVGRVVLPVRAAE